MWQYVTSHKAVRACILQSICTLPWIQQKIESVTTMASLWSIRNFCKLQLKVRDLWPHTFNGEHEPVCANMVRNDAATAEQGIQHPGVNTPTSHFFQTYRKHASKVNDKHFMLFNTDFSSKTCILVITPVWEKQFIPAFDFRFLKLPTMTRRCLQLFHHKTHLDSIQYSNRTLQTCTFHTINVTLKKT